MKHQILLIDDSEIFQRALRFMLKQLPLELVWAKTGTDGIQTFRENPHRFATVILDYDLPDMKGSEVAPLITKLNSEQEILFASGHQNPEYLIDLLETGGARSFLRKDREPEELRERILASVASYEKHHRVLGLDRYSPEQAEIELRAEGFVGRSPALYGILEKIRTYRSSPYPVLIVGQTGTGKELVARALAPSKKDLIVVNCPEFTENENLLCSHLFGHVKGAFTGADRDKPGLLDQAQGKTLFFDELHALSLSAQAKILRLLQEMQYTRFGDPTGRPISLKCQVIAAVKPEIFSLIKEGRFLEDLYNRVAQLEIQIPPLHERSEDIEPLVRAIQDEFNAGKAPHEKRQIRIPVIEEMKKQPWPGNVRALQAAVRQMLTHAKNEIVGPSDFDEFLRSRGLANSVSENAVPLSNVTQLIESEWITNTLRRSKTLTEAARVLGLDRWKLNRKLLRLGVNDPKSLLIAERKMMGHHKEGVRP